MVREKRKGSRQGKVQVEDEMKRRKGINEKKRKKRKRQEEKEK